MSAFVAFLYQQGLSATAFKSYLAAVRHAQIALGLEDPVMVGMPQLQYVLKGASRRLTGRGGRTRLPITPAILRQLRHTWESHPSRADAVMLWAVATLCFFAFLRMGEAVIPSDSRFDARTHLSYGDIRVNSTSNPLWVEVHIKHSKCDQFSKAVTLSVGATHMDICLVAAMLGYLVERESLPGPLFKFTDGRYLTRNRFVSALRAALGECGIDSALYAGHSFRIGVATTAALRGMQDSLIKTLGRWDSSAYMTYIHTPQSTLISVAIGHSCHCQTDLHTTHVLACAPIYNCYNYYYISANSH